MTIATDHIPEYRVVNMGDRVAVDLLGAVFSGALEGEAALPVDSDVFSSVRYNQHRGRLGVWLSPHPSGGAGPQGRCQLRQKHHRGGGQQRHAHFRHSLRLPRATPIDPNKYTVVLDAGHDGKTLGAVYPDANGVDICRRISPCP